MKTNNNFTLSAKLISFCHVDNFEGYVPEKSSLAGKLVTCQVVKDWSNSEFKYDLAIRATKVLPKEISPWQIKEAIESIFLYFSPDEAEQLYKGIDESLDDILSAHIWFSWDYTQCMKYTIPQFFQNALGHNCFFGVRDTSGLKEEHKSSLVKFLAIAEKHFDERYPDSANHKWILSKGVTHTAEHDVTGIGAEYCVTARLVPEFSTDPEY